MKEKVADVVYNNCYIAYKKTLNANSAWNESESSKIKKKIRREKNTFRKT